MKTRKARTPARTEYTTAVPKPREAINLGKGRQTSASEVFTPEVGFLVSNPSSTYRSQVTDMPQISIDKETTTTPVTNKTGGFTCLIVSDLVIVTSNKRLVKRVDRKQRTCIVLILISSFFFQ